MKPKSQGGEVTKKGSQNQTGQRVDNLAVLPGAVWVAISGAVWGGHRGYTNSDQDRALGEIGLQEVTAREALQDGRGLQLEFPLNFHAHVQPPAAIV